MSILLDCVDNVEFMREAKVMEIKFDLIYADMIYENLNFHWLELACSLLKDGGVLEVQTDYHSVADVKLFLDDELDFLNWCIYINDWGATPRRGFPAKHDDILIYTKGPNFKWYKDRIQIVKRTAGTGYDKKGTGLKTPCDVFYDKISFSTLALERVKDSTGHNIRWQKPQWLYDRIILPFTDEGDTIYDPFMGSGSLALWCKRNKRNYFGNEIDLEVYNIARETVNRE